MCEILFSIGILILMGLMIMAVFRLITVHPPKYTGNYSDGIFNIKRLGFSLLNNTFYCNKLCIFLVSFVDLF